MASSLSTSINNSGIHSSAQQQQQQLLNTFQSLSITDPKLVDEQPSPDQHDAGGSGAATTAGCNDDQESEQWFSAITAKVDQHFDALHEQVADKIRPWQGLQ